MGQNLYVLLPYKKFNFSAVIYMNFSSGFSSRKGLQQENILYLFFFYSSN